MSKREDYIYQSPSIDKPSYKLTVWFSSLKTNTEDSRLRSPARRAALMRCMGETIMKKRSEERMRCVSRRCIGEELMKTFQPTSPHVIWKTRPISPRYKMTKDVPRPLFPRRQLSHAIVLCMENFPKPLFSFRIAVLFLSFLPTTLIYRLPEQLQTCTNMVRALVHA